MEKKTYNGWTNWETWCINLHITNDQGWNDQKEQIIEEWWDNQCHEGNNPKKELHDLANTIQEWCEEDFEMLKEDMDAPHHKPSSFPLIFSDIIQGFLSNVNWFELAENWTEEKEVWVAGWNMPGYLPDTDPATFADFESAKQYIVDTMLSHADDETDNPNHKEGEAFCSCPMCELEKCACDLADAKDEFNCHAGSLVYWLVKG